MKKIFKMFVLLLLFNITKVEAITFTSSYIGNYHYVEDSGRWGDFEMFYRTDNQKVAYVSSRVLIKQPKIIKNIQGR